MQQLSLSDNLYFGSNGQPLTPSPLGTRSLPQEKSLAYFCSRQNTLSAQSSEKINHTLHVQSKLLPLRDFDCRGWHIPDWGIIAACNIPTPESETFSIEVIKSFIDLFLHLDEYRATIIQTYGLLTYAILFVVIFVETGQVVMPCLPDDSLIFAAGTLAEAKPDQGVTF